MRNFSFRLVVLFTAAFMFPASSLIAQQSLSSELRWHELPELPGELGVAGPFAGVHGDALIVAGGANFPKPVWDNDKVWHDTIQILVRTPSNEGFDYKWQDVSAKLPHPLAYGASVSIPDGLNVPSGVLCMGGNDGEQPDDEVEHVFDDVFMLSWDATTKDITFESYPSLPMPVAFTSATRIGPIVYLAGGQTGTDLDSASNHFWSLDLRMRGNEDFGWRSLAPIPGKGRALHMTVTQHDGFNDGVYVISGRRKVEGVAEFLNDVWQFTPTTGTWRQRASAPTAVMAGTAIGHGQSHLFVLGGADGTLFYRGNELKDNHPGFPKKAYAYHTITDSWIDAGAIPANHVTTTAVKWGNDIVIPSGEERPRVRSRKIWRITVDPSTRSFGVVNYVVLAGYLLAMVGIGAYFTRKNKNTDDFFRGGKRIPWWAAGCSIFATMLSSLTYTGIPSKAFAQDWVYAIGNAMIPPIAIVAVFFALPFYRRIDATSAYEYLEKRFSRSVRWFGSGSFALFHVFRMAVVMSLTGLALAVATPLTPVQSVLLMGVLSIAYSAMGGIEAVIWTDTIQTFVLLGGAVVAVVVLLSGIDGGFAGFMSTAADGDKLRLFNHHWDPSDAKLALWVVVIGGLGQSLASYTSDQAVVQRYMTTETEKLAARSIWTNAVLSVFATILFFGIGTGLHAFYQSHPERLDATITTDQVFPLFIAREIPLGISGLIVAGIFAAAQSTVSTSMNSMATTVVTDFLRPANVFRSEQGYLNAARVLTVLIGTAGTLIGIVFVNPEIKSLFDSFLKVIGLFMGTLGGLFVLGALTQRANATGAMVGALAGAAVMVGVWQLTPIQGILYTAIGIATCFVVGYLTSVATGGTDRELGGLTVFTLDREPRGSVAGASG